MRASPLQKQTLKKNLENAHAFFDSYLQSVFSQRSKAWELSTLGKVCEFIGGSQPPKSVFSKTKKADNIRLIQIRDYKSNDHVVYIPLAQARRFCTADDVMIGRYGPPLFQILRGLQGAYNVALMKAEPDESKLSRDFLFYFLKHSTILQYVIFHSERAAGQIGLTKETLEPYPIALPSLAEQEAIVQKILELEAKTKRLARLYERKLAALEELQKSLLQQAFTGKLNGAAEMIEPVESIVASFPIQIPNISPTDLHAGILAMAFQMHEQHGKQDFFGHVKAEKIAHMVEASLGINLGRSPVKDAAGPNDFSHLVKVEHRARMANHFNFKRVDGSEHYRVEKLRGFQRLIDKACTALGEKCDNVERLLQLMLPMTAKQAEIMATVFAAWNNVLLDGKQPTDEQIVFEARENWHADKLKIDRQKFFAAVQWLREKGIVPEGRGKKVEPKRK